MGWCSLIDSDNYELGCIDRPKNSHNSKLFATLAKFNPFKPINDVFYQDLAAIERRDKSKRFTESKIDQIDLCYLTAHPTSVGAVILTMNEG
jgi:hypothetical protein